MNVSRGTVARRQALLQEMQLQTSGAAGTWARKVPEARWSWRRVGSSALLARAFHSADLVGDKLVVYGGRGSADPQERPLSNAVVLGAGLLEVEGVVPDGPPRSHHGTAVMQGRWLLAVGGWDGRRRLAGLQALDLGGSSPPSWRLLEPEVGSQQPAGLSGHSVTKLSEQRLWVVGREGGVRTQRRFSSIFQLHVNIQRGSYRYKEQASHSDSRSGHTAILCQNGRNFQLLLLGGRNTPFFQLAGQWGEGEIKDRPPSAPRLVERLSSLIADRLVTPSIPRARRHHCMVQVGPFVVLHGGECFNKTFDTVCSDLYIYDTRG
ncbi:kelch domain-containing protein 9-like isoform X2 [Narcine bancroftii]|uniref:kelch domain-containing protein 9-like isoform X2 n=1 Tax=Narcine bancroftii TaxID=1343680 RepID=UPI0038316B2B